MKHVNSLFSNVPLSVVLRHPEDITTMYCLLLLSWPQLPLTGIKHTYILNYGHVMQSVALSYSAAVRLVDISALSSQSQMATGPSHINLLLIHLDSRA